SAAGSEGEAPAEKPSRDTIVAVADDRASAERKDEQAAAAGGVGKSEPKKGDMGKPEPPVVEPSLMPPENTREVAGISPAPEKPPRPPRKEQRLLSGSGNWSGPVVLERGCGSCHGSGKAKPFSPDDKTRRQWRFFFRRNRHDRYARLRNLFSRAELDRALQTILSRMTKKEKTGIAGEK
ncbi:MAG: hypothetical protein D6806_04100, partial [Deltaproteobacteria bacterium]